MLRRTFLVAVAAAVGALYAGPGTAQSLDEVLEKHYEAIGGLDAWQGVQSVKFSGKMVLMGGAMEAPITIMQKRPSMARVEFTVQGMQGVQAYDGETAWIQMPFMGSPDPEPAPADMVSQMKEQADLDGPLVGWQDEGHTLELVGKEDVDGTETFKVKVTHNSGEVSHYYLDSEYYLPIKVTAVRNVQGAESEITTILGAYKEVQGLVVPFSIEVTSPMGPQVISFETIEVNVSLDDGIFSMPGK
jgi:outer membrane lipoprotein-sorting protein